MDERRSAPRLREETTIFLYVLSEDTGGQRRGIPVLGLDISTTGVRCRVAEFVPVDARLRMELRLGKTGQELSAVGNARWINDLQNTELYEVGIEFDDRSPDFIKALEDYIQRRLM